MLSPPLTMLRRACVCARTVVTVQRRGGCPSVLAAPSLAGGWPKRARSAAFPPSVTCDALDDCAGRSHRTRFCDVAESGGCAAPSCLPATSTWCRCEEGCARHMSTVSRSISCFRGQAGSRIRALVSEIGGQKRSSWRSLLVMDGGGSVGRAWHVERRHCPRATRRRTAGP